MALSSCAKAFLILIDMAAREKRIFLDSSLQRTVDHGCCQNLNACTAEYLPAEIGLRMRTGQLAWRLAQAEMAGVLVTGEG